MSESQISEIERFLIMQDLYQIRREMGQLGVWERMAHIWHQAKRELLESAR